MLSWAIDLLILPPPGYIQSVRRAPSLGLMLFADSGPIVMPRHRRLWTPHSPYLEFGGDKKIRQRRYKNLISEILAVDVIAKIRHCTNKGLILGSETFRQQFPALTGDPAPEL